MQSYIFVGLFAGICAGFLIGWFIAQTRIRDLKRIIDESSAREKAAVDRVSELDESLKDKIAQNGALQSVAERLGEAQRALEEKGLRLQNCQGLIAELEKAKELALSERSSAIKQADAIVLMERETLGKLIEAKDHQIASLTEFIGQAKTALSQEFKAVSVEVLENASSQLIKTADGLIEKHGRQTSTEVDKHKSEIKSLLLPVEQTIKNLDQHVADSNQARIAAEALLNEQVQRLAGASESLSNALRKPVIRGSWGEIELENTLESAGLEREIDFLLQHTTDDEDGRKRTDAIINLPKGRKLVIDSKNLMDSYVPLMNAVDESQRVVLADKHSQSLRNHIRALSSKEYWRRYEGLDCVILFIPHDGMYHAAIKDEAELIRDACSKRVFIANPMSLIPLLKAVRYVLDQERLNKSAAEISIVGTKLYEEITRFAAKMVTIGDKLRGTVDAYNKALPALDRYIISNSRKLKKLGSGKGAEPAKIEEIRDIEPNRFTSRELRDVNSLFEDDAASFAMTANAEDES